MKLLRILKNSPTLQRLYRFLSGAVKVLEFSIHIRNPVVREQLSDYKSIPIIIISFNQLTHLKAQVSFLLKNGYNNVIIIDNNSSYPPLLEYFEAMKRMVTIHILAENRGHMAFWHHSELYTLYSKGFYIVTDADVVPIEACPENFVQQLIQKFIKNRRFTKVGLSLKLDDIPDSNLSKKEILLWEQQYWTKKNSNHTFIAAIDTTFALYRPFYSYSKTDFFKSIRTDFPLQARHGGWYIDHNRLTEEQEFYFSTCNSSSSWRLDKNKKIIHSKYKIAKET